MAEVNVSSKKSSEQTSQAPELKTWTVPFGKKAPQGHEIVINQQQARFSDGTMKTTTFQVFHAYEDLTGRWTPDAKSEHVYPIGFLKGADGEELSIEQQGDRLAQLFGESDDPMTEMLLLSNQVTLEGIEQMKRLSERFKGSARDQMKSIANGKPLE